MMNWLSTHAPPWMFGVALWKWDHYYEVSGGGPMPAESFFRNTTPLLKEIPAC